MHEPITGASPAGPLCNVTIPVFNRPAATQGAIRALANTSREVAFQITVVDNGSEPELVKTLLHLRDIADRAKVDLSIVSEMRDVRNRALAEVTRADDFVVTRACSDPSPDGGVWRVHRNTGAGFAAVGCLVAVEQAGKRGDDQMPLVAAVIDNEGAGHVGPPGWREDGGEKEAADGPS